MAIHSEILLPIQHESKGKAPSSKKRFSSIKKWDKPKVCDDIITVLNKLSTPQVNNSLISFCQRAKDHFGDKMIPLTTLLDPIFGLGYAFHKNDQLFSTQRSFTKSIHRVESEIFDSVINNITEQFGKTHTIYLTNNNILDLEDNMDMLPEVFALRITTCCENGEEKYLINYAFPAGNLLERILPVAEDNISDDAKIKLEKIQTQFQKTYNAEIQFSSFPSPIENPAAANKQIVSIYPIFDPTGDVIFPNDLYFSTTNVESGIYAYSKKTFLTPYVPATQNNVEPQVTFGTFFRDMYQFLNPSPVFACYIMNNHKVFFPRIEYNNLILFPRTWIFNTTWIFHSNATTHESIQQLQDLFRLYCVPQYIIIQDSLTDIVRSTTDPYDLLQTIQTIRSRCFFVFCEAIGLKTPVHQQKEKNNLAEYLLISKEGTD